MRAIYFKSSSLDIFILLCMRRDDHVDRCVILDEIRFFWKESDVKSYIEKNTFENLNISSLEKQGIISEFVNLINEYISGKKINLYSSLTNLNIDLSFKEKFRTDFSQKVMKVVSQLKYGEIISYSSIGQRINSKAYRAIGSILSKNPIPLIIPFHRVLGKNGIGGFMGENTGGKELLLKKKLLEIEGILDIDLPLLKKEY